MLIFFLNVFLYFHREATVDQKSMAVLFADLVYGGSKGREIAYGPLFPSTERYEKGEEAMNDVCSVGHHGLDTQRVKTWRSVAWRSPRMERWRGRHWIDHSSVSIQHSVRGTEQHRTF